MTVRVFVMALHFRKGNWWKEQMLLCGECERRKRLRARSISSKFCHYFPRFTHRAFLDRIPNENKTGLLSRANQTTANNFRLSQKNITKTDGRRIFIERLRQLFSFDKDHWTKTSRVKVAGASALTEDGTAKNTTRTIIPTPPDQIADGTIALPGHSMTSKESVFFKMNNRIRALEVNLSLNAQYLSELSRKFVAQIDDMHRLLNRTQRLLNETQARLDSSESALSVKLADLQMHFAALSDTLKVRDSLLSSFIPLLYYLLYWVM